MAASRAWEASADKSVSSCDRRRAQVSSSARGCDNAAGLYLQSCILATANALSQYHKNGRGRHAPVDKRLDLQVFVQLILDCGEMYPDHNHMVPRKRSCRQVFGRNFDIPVMNRWGTAHSQRQTRVEDVSMPEHERTHITPRAGVVTRVRRARGLLSVVTQNAADIRRLRHHLPSK